MIVGLFGAESSLSRPNVFVDVPEPSLPIHSTVAW